MPRVRILAVLALVSVVTVWAQSPAQQSPSDDVFELVASSKGKNWTVLSPSIVVNKKSTIERTTYFIKDPKSPIVIDTAALTTRFEANRYSGDYRYWAILKGKSSQSISAVEFVFAAFDLWGERTKNLAGDMIEDMPAGSEINFEGKWRLLSENEAGAHLDAFAFVRRVRLSDGTVWYADLPKVARTIAKQGPKITQDDLSNSADNPGSPNVGTPTSGSK